MDKVIWKVYQVIITVVLAGMATAAIMIFVKWLIDLGPIWTFVAIGALGVIAYVVEKGKEER